MWSVADLFIPTSHTEEKYQNITSREQLKTTKIESLNSSTFSRSIGPKRT